MQHISRGKMAHVILCWRHSDDENWQPCNRCSEKVTQMLLCSKGEENICQGVVKSMFRKHALIKKDKTANLLATKHVQTSQDKQTFGFVFALRRWCLCPLFLNIRVQLSFSCQCSAFKQQLNTQRWHAGVREARVSQIMMHAHESRWSTSNKPKILLGILVLNFGRTHASSRSRL